MDSSQKSSFRSRRDSLQQFEAYARECAMRWSSLRAQMSASTSTASTGSTSVGLTHAAMRTPQLFALIDFVPDVDGALITASSTLVLPYLAAVVDSILDRLTSATPATTATTALSSDFASASSTPPALSIARRAQPQPGMVGDADNRHRNPIQAPSVLTNRLAFRDYLEHLLCNEDWSESSMVWTYIGQTGSAPASDIRPFGAPSGGSVSGNLGPAAADVDPVAIHGGVTLEVIIEVIMAAGDQEAAGEWTPEQKARAAKAWNKLIWLQIDIFARHQSA